MPRFFNNCRRFPHKERYPVKRGTEGTAFYDLYRTGKQASMATDLKRGEECLVATPNEDGDVEFVRFSFSHEERGHQDGESMRVFFGKRLSSKTLPKTKAAKTEPYSVFFDKNGNFKRLSVIKPKTGRRR